MNERYQQIRQQILDLEREASALKAEAIKEALVDIRAKVHEFGLTAEDIFSHRTPSVLSKFRPHVVIKYRDDKGHAWSGRGKTPKWLLDAEAEGKSRDDFLV